MPTNPTPSMTFVDQVTKFLAECERQRRKDIRKYERQLRGLQTKRKLMLTNRHRRFG